MGNNNTSSRSFLNDIYTDLSGVHASDAKVEIILKKPNAFQTVKEHFMNLKPSSKTNRKKACYCLLIFSTTKQGRVDLFNDQELFTFLCESVVNEADEDCKKWIYKTIFNISHEKENRLNMFGFVDELMKRGKEETNQESREWIYYTILIISIEIENRSNMFGFVHELMKRGKEETNQESRKWIYCTIYNISREKENQSKMFGFVDELMQQGKEETNHEYRIEIYNTIYNISLEIENRSKMFYLVDELMQRGKDENNHECRAKIYKTIYNISLKIENQSKMFGFVYELMKRRKEETNNECKKCIDDAITSISSDKKNSSKMVDLARQLMTSGKEETNHECRTDIYKTIYSISCDKENQSEMFDILHELIVRSNRETNPECIQFFHKIFYQIARTPSNRSKMANMKELLDFLFLGAMNSDVFACIALANIVGIDETLQHYFKKLDTDALSEIINTLDSICDPNDADKEIWELKDLLYPLRNMACIEKFRKKMAKEVIALLPKAFKHALDANDDESIELIFSLYSQFAKDPYYETIFHDDPNIRTQIKVLRKIDRFREIADRLALELFLEEEAVLDAIPILNENNNSLSIMTSDEVYEWTRSLGGDFNDVAEALKNENVNGNELKDLYESGIEAFGYIFMGSQIEKKTIARFYAKTGVMLSTITAATTV